MNLFATKPLERILGQAEGKHALLRTLGPVSLVLLGIGAIIGAGLFSLTGIAAAKHAGPAVVLSFVVAAIGCVFAGMCYSEFATMIPIAGSAYTYAYATMGELLAWIIGWDLVLEYAVGAATVSVSWSEYVVRLFRDSFGIELSQKWTHGPWDSTLGYSTPGYINLPAVLVIVMISTLLIVGTQESARVNAIIVVVKVAIVLCVIVVGFAFVHPEYYHPFIPKNTGKFGEFGFSGIMRAAAVIFFAYIGFDAVSTAAQEAKNPKRDMPLGIIGSLGICTILYVLFALVLTGLARYKDLDNGAPVATAIAALPYPWLKVSVIVGIIFGYTSVILVMLLGQSRVFFSMSRDGLLPAVFSDIHPRFRTPWHCNLIFMIFVSLFSGFLPISSLGHMTSIGTLLAFVIVCAGVIVMRRTRPDIPRPYRTPFVPLFPILGILVCLAMMASLDGLTWIRLVLWLAIGLLIYFGYGRRHSFLARDQAAKPAARS
jgi:APA family basic amino acid/polyamine antiporter